MNNTAPLRMADFPPDPTIRSERANLNQTIEETNEFTRPQARQKRSLSILCIDDDAQVRQLLSAFLVRFNHRVMVASGGKHGMELFRTAMLNHQPYEVVITDLGMPDIDGYDVARSVKAESPNTPVIMMTGWGTAVKEDGETVPEVDAVISKPPRMQELNNLLLQICSLDFCFADCAERGSESLA